MKDKRITLGDEERSVAIEGDGDITRATIGDNTIPIRIIGESDGELLVEINGRQHHVPYLRKGDLIHFNFLGESWEAEIASPLQSIKRHKEHSMGAPMPGSVLKIHVAVGDEVTKGAALITLEAMKMEHQITAPYDGIVSSIDCAEGAMVSPGVDLIAVDPRESGE